MMRILLATTNEPLALLIRRALARFHYEFSQVDNGLDAFQKAISVPFDLIIMEYDLPRMMAHEVLRRFGSIENFVQPPVLLITLSEEEREQIEGEHFARTEVVPRPLAIRDFVSRVQEILHHGIRVACLGGGTGLFTLLSGLKTISGLHLSSIVSMSDDGGSTGMLRDAFGILPPGDIRRSLVALSSAPDLLNELIQYRFNRGGELKGHNLGNLLLTALSEIRGNMTQAVRALGEILNIQGHVIPVTETINTLKAELQNDTVIEGEHRIDMFEGIDLNVRIKKLWQDPKVSATPDALEVLHNAHFILLGPGDLYTSVICNLLVEGIVEALLSSKARKIYICNVMTKPGETTNFQVSDHVSEMIKYLRKDILDYVICSSTQFSKEALEVYAKKNQIPVIEKSRTTLQKTTRARIVWADVAHGQELVRHDSLHLAAELKKIIDHEKPARTLR